jgi:hypothetical protein
MAIPIAVASMYVSAYVCKLVNMPMETAEPIILQTFVMTLFWFM